MRLDELNFFDIETSDWVDPVLLVTDCWPPERNFEKGALRILYSGRDWAAFNGGKYDTIFIADVARRNGLRFQTVMSGSRIAIFKATDYQTKIFDLVALMPMSLKKAAELCGRPIKKDTGLKCVCGVDCGGYCAISGSMSEEEFAALTRYAELDISTTKAVTLELARFGKDLGVVWGSTLGSSSWKTAKRLSKSVINPWTNSPAMFKFLRKAYKGGRCEVFRKRALSGFASDINTAYGAALVYVDLPAGKPEWGIPLRGDPAICMADIDCPIDTFIPPLGINVFGSLVFPVGKFSGIFTNLELDYAEDCGVKVSRKQGIVFNDWDRPFKSHQQLFWDWRLDKGKKSFDGVMSKWFLVSLAGKLGAKPEIANLVHEGQSEPVSCDPFMKKHKRGECPPTKCCYHRCIGGHAKYSYVGKGFWTIEKFKIQINAQPHWVSYMTASVRCALHKQLTKVDKGEDAIYCDTDGVKTMFSRYPLGDKLGEWGADGPNGGVFYNFQAVAPKVYSFTNAESEEIVKAKGLPGLKDVAAWESGTPHHESKGIIGLKAALRKPGGLVHRKNISRNHHANSDFCGSRVIGKDGEITFPINANQLERLRR